VGATGDELGLGKSVRGINVALYEVALCRCKLIGVILRHIGPSDRVYLAVNFVSVLRRHLL